MAVLTYKGGKYSNLAGNQMYDCEKGLKMNADSKIYLNDKLYNLSFSKKEPTDLPDIENPDIVLPEFHELNGHTLT